MINIISKLIKFQIKINIFENNVPYMNIVIIFQMTKIMCSDYKETLFNDYYNLVVNKNKEEINKYSPNIYKLTYYSRLLDEIFYEIDDYINDLKSYKEDMEYMHINRLLKHNENKSDLIFNFFFGNIEKLEELIEPEFVIRKYHCLEDKERDLYMYVNDHLNSLCGFDYLKFPAKEIENWIENIENPDKCDLNGVNYRLKTYCEELSSMYYYLSNQEFYLYNYKTDCEAKIAVLLESCKKFSNVVKKCHKTIVEFGHELFENDRYFNNWIEKYMKAEDDTSCILS